MTFIPDRDMDKSYLVCKNIPICWRSAIKITFLIYYESIGKE